MADNTEKPGEYQVIARKWRPQKFSEVVGQDHIIRTLRNELLNQRTAHAYLFVGPRGIGKTTIARIFAKALNCRKAPAAEPCCECDTCRSIADGSCLDVIEIDGASNNSVENIRSLRDEVHYTPVSGRYKVYIIDEVHMLSIGAWNALLKTVEEPPRHVKFLFATTEAHKVLATIVSRCQRFDLRRIPAGVIAANLKNIADTEKVRISQGAIAAIARAADGGIRDAQSLLDQMISFFSGGDHEIAEAEVLEIFGLTSEADMQALVMAVFNNDRAAVVSSIHKFALQGRNMEKLFDDLLGFLRAVLICQIVPDPDTILEAGEESVAAYRKAAAAADAAKVQILIESLSPAARQLRDAMNKQVFLEAAVMKAMRLAHAVKVEDLIGRLQYLREKGELAFLDKAGGSPKGAAEQGVHGDRPGEKKIDTPKAEPPPNQQPLKPDPTRVQSSAAQQTHPPPPPPDPKFTAESLWHALIEEIGKINNPLLKSYMQEGKPVSLGDGELVVEYDEDSEKLYIEKLRAETKTLLICLHRVSGNRNLALSIRAVKGADTPPAKQKPSATTTELKDKMQKNSFVQNVVKLFDGKIVEVRG